MRREESVEKTEIVTEETVYCDQCASECTDSFEMVPMELCDSCNPDKSRTLKEYRNKFIPNGESIDPFSLKEMVVFTLLFPLAIGFAFFDAIDGAAYGPVYLIGSAGVLLWIVLPLLLL